MVNDVQRAGAGGTTSSCVSVLYFRFPTVEHLPQRPVSRVNGRTPGLAAVVYNPFRRPVYSLRRTYRTPPCFSGIGWRSSFRGPHIVAPLGHDPPRPAPATDALRRLRTHPSVVNIGQFHLKNQQLALKIFSSSRKKNVVLLCSAQSSTVWTLGASRRRACALACVIFSIFFK